MRSHVLGISRKEFVYALRKLQSRPKTTLPKRIIYPIRPRIPNETIVQGITSGIISPFVEKWISFDSSRCDVHAANLSRVSKSHTFGLRRRFYIVTLVFFQYTPPREYGILWSWGGEACEAFLGKDLSVVGTCSAYCSTLSVVDLPLILFVMIAINGATLLIWDNYRFGGRCCLTIGCLAKLALQAVLAHLVDGFLRL